jgi:serine/threonine protein kinase
MIWGGSPLDRAQRLAEQMAAGLGAAHQAGIVHRDFTLTHCRRETPDKPVGIDMVESS